jgi:cytosine permease
MDAFDKEVEIQQERQGAEIPTPAIDTSMLSKLLKVVSWGSLLVTTLLAINAFSLSPDVANYESNREMFFNLAFVCTIIYFTTAYWSMRRHKALAK